MEDSGVNLKNDLLTIEHFHVSLWKVAEYKPAISNSMREKLLAEASTGLDSEKKQTNVILYISVAVAILVALGGSGTLY